MSKIISELELMKDCRNFQPKSFTTNMFSKGNGRIRKSGGRVKGVGLMRWVNIKKLVKASPSAGSADEREAHFIGELIIKSLICKILVT